MLQLKGEYQKYKGITEIYPPVEKIFSAFSHFNQKDLKVIIIGQDPYHVDGDRQTDWRFRWRKE